MQNEQVTNKLPSKLSLIVRLMVSCYLIYTVYSLGDVWNRYTGGELLLYLIIMVLFGLAAFIMGILAIRDLIIGKYYGGALDNSEVTKEELNNKDI